MACRCHFLEVFLPAIFLLFIKIYNVYIFTSWKPLKSGIVHISTSINYNTYIFISIKIVFYLYNFNFQKSIDSLFNATFALVHWQGIHTFLLGIFAWNLKYFNFFDFLYDFCIKLVLSFLFLCFRSATKF